MMLKWCYQLVSFVRFHNKMDWETAIELGSGQTGSCQTPQCYWKCECFKANIL